MSTTSGVEQAMEEARAAVVSKVKSVKRRKAPTIAPEASDEPTTEQVVDAIENDPIETAPGEGLIETVEEARKEKRVKKTKSKPKSKKAPSKKAKAPTKTKKAPSKGKAPKRRKATEAQLKAAKNKLPRRNWVKDIENFRKAKANNLSIEMGTPGSAQVTKARLDNWEGFKGLKCFTSKSLLFITKLSVEEAKAAAKKAGKL